MVINITQKHIYLEVDTGHDEDEEYTKHFEDLKNTLWLGCTLYQRIMARYPQWVDEGTEAAALHSQGINKQQTGKHEQQLVKNMCSRYNMLKGFFVKFFCIHNAFCAMNEATRQYTRQLSNQRQKFRLSPCNKDHKTSVQISSEIKTLHHTVGCSDRHWRLTSLTSPLFYVHRLNLYVLLITWSQTPHWNCNGGLELIKGWIHQDQYCQSGWDSAIFKQVGLKLLFWCSTSMLFTTSD